MSPFCTEVLASYIREDLAALDHPHRQDTSLIMRDLKFLFRAYRYAGKKIEDWMPGSRAPSADGTLNNLGGN